MDSIENGATIRIGLREYSKHIYHLLESFYRPVFSIKINKRTFLNMDYPGNKEDYLNSCIESAKEIAKVMKENNIKNYAIYNGERVRFSNSKWESCNYMPRDGEEIFKKTLEETLNQSNLKILPSQKNFPSSPFSFFNIVPSCCSEPILK